MVNRYSGEIHINPISQLRNGDFNNDGKINDIDTTLFNAINTISGIEKRLQGIKGWLKNNNSNAAQFHFAEAGFIGIKGLTDGQLKDLAAKGYIQLFDFANDKTWVIKYGHLFGLVWENGQAVEI